MAYSGYSWDEYWSEVQAIVGERYANPEKVANSYDAYRSARMHYDMGDSPTRAAQSAAYTARLRRRERFWLGEGPKIESGYAETNRVGSRREWRTVVVSDALNRRARFLGWRNIDGNQMAVWRVDQRLYAQTAVGPRHPSHFQQRDSQRRQTAGYYTVVIPYTDVGQTKWHPTDRTGPFSTLTRGSFRTSGEAHHWAKEHLGRTHFSVRHVKSVPTQPFRRLRRRSS